MTNPTCPACGSELLHITDDFERNLKIVMCGECGESYCASNSDIYELGLAVVFAEWRGSYAKAKRVGWAVSGE